MGLLDGVPRTVHLSNPHNGLGFCSRISQPFFGFGFVAFRSMLSRFFDLNGFALLMSAFWLNDKSLIKSLNLYISEILTHYVIFKVKGISISNDKKRQLKFVFC